MSIDQLRQLTVTAFPQSAERPQIFAELERLFADLTARQLVGELWINGSFLTEKIVQDPDDIDLSLAIRISDIENRAPDVQNFVLSTLNGGRRYSHLLDTYVCVIFPRDDPRWAGSTEDYWAEKWGVGWDDWLKGFAVVRLGESDVRFGRHP